MNYDRQHIFSLAMLSQFSAPRAGCISARSSGVSIDTALGGSLRRDKMLSTTSSLTAPVSSASRAALSTAFSPSVSTAASTRTNRRSPSLSPPSLRRSRASAVGRSQSWNGSPFLRPVPQRAGLVHQHRQIMPGIVDRAVTTGEAGVLGDNLVAHPRTGEPRKLRTRV